MDQKEQGEQALRNWKDHERVRQQYNAANKTIPTRISFRFSHNGELGEGQWASLEPIAQMRDTGKGPYEVDLFFPNTLRGPVTMWGVDEGFAATLTGLVRALRPKVCLETGSNKGRSTRAIADGLAYNLQGHLTTVDLVDHNIMQTGAIPPELHPYVTPVITKLPEGLEHEPLCSLQDIDFAFIDAEHTAQAVEDELAFVDAHRAEECLVLIDNSRDEMWPEVEEYLNAYTKYPVLNIPTMCGTGIIHMADHGSPDDTH